MIDDDFTELRCFCGHYKREHDTPRKGVDLRGHVRKLSPCHGAYATLAADDDDHESVEVQCRCDSFAPVEPGHHEIR